MSSALSPVFCSVSKIPSRRWFCRSVNYERKVSVSVTVVYHSAISKAFSIILCIGRVQCSVIRWVMIKWEIIVCVSNVCYCFPLCVNKGWLDFFFIRKTVNRRGEANTVFLVGRWSGVISRGMFLLTIFLCVFVWRYKLNLFVYPRLLKLRN